MCGSGYMNYPNVLPPTLNLFSKFWENIYINLTILNEILNFYAFSF